MDVDFDPKKAASNFKKHGVSFAEAEPVLYDSMALTREDNDAEGEARFVSVGMGALGRVLTVVWALCGETARLISARESTSNERRAYES